MRVEKIRRGRARIKLIMPPTAPAEPAQADALLGQSWVPDSFVFYPTQSPWWVAAALFELGHYEGACSTSGQLQRRAGEVRLATASTSA